MSDGPDWFAPKRYGYGAGLPISWQGWVLTLAFLLATSLLAVALGRRPMQLMAAIIPVSAAFIVICVRTTRGGWRWRWGEDE